MDYPLISEYIEAIKAAEENFEELKHLRPVLDDDGEPMMTSGNFAVVFKMKNEQTGKLHAVKCFLKEQEGRAEAYRMIAEELEYVNSTFLTPIKYLDKELLVDSKNSDESEFPVLLMDWVEGQTLDKYIQKYVYRYQRAENLDETTESQEKAVELLANGYELDNIAYQFSCLAIWLLQQPFAHGDLKPDNIIVKEDGTLVLVDYDGMYVPAMKGQKARELGSPDFRHPLRNENDFDEHIDDFPLSSILLSLLAIANEPSLFEKYGGDGRLLLSERDYRNIAESEVLDALRPLMADKSLTTYLSLFYLCSAQKSLFKESYHLFTLPEPEKPSFMLDEENLSTEITEEDLANAWVDEFGVKYSKDRKRLLEAPMQIIRYSIKKGTKVICNCAFERSYRLQSLSIPESVCLIGDVIFSYPNSLQHILVDAANRFYDSRNNCNAIIKRESKTLIYGCSSTIIPCDIKVIGEHAFDSCERMRSMSIPSGVIRIAKSAFSNCVNLRSISIPGSVLEIDDEAFSGCKKLTSFFIPGSVSKIGRDIFLDCNSSSELSVEESNTYYDSRERCNAIVESESNTLIIGCKTTVIPNTVLFIGDSAFYRCRKIENINIPLGVKKIGYNSFEQCHCLKNLVISASVNEIAYSAFCKCENLNSIIVANENPIYDSRNNCNAIIETKSNSLLVGCNNTIIPNDIISIANHAFCGRDRLVSVAIPKSVLQIGGKSFSYCI